MSTPRGFHSRSRTESTRGSAGFRSTPTGVRSSRRASSGAAHYQPRESLFDRPPIQRCLDEGDSDVPLSDDENPSASLTFTSEGPDLPSSTPLASSSLHNRRSANTSEIVGMLQQQQQLLHKVLEEQEEMKKDNQLLRRQLLSLEEEVRSKSSSSSGSSTPCRKKFKVTRDLTVQHYCSCVCKATCLLQNKVAAIHDSLEEGLRAYER